MGCGSSAMEPKEENGQTVDTEDIHDVESIDNESKNITDQSDHAGGDTENPLDRSRVPLPPIRSEEISSDDQLPPISSAE